MLANLHLSVIPANWSTHSHTSSSSLWRQLMAVTLSAAGRKRSWPRLATVVDLGALSLSRKKSNFKRFGRSADYFHLYNGHFASRWLKWHWNYLSAGAAYRLALCTNRSVGVSFRFCYETGTDLALGWHLSTPVLATSCR